MSHPRFPLANGLIGLEVFSASVIVVLGTTIVTPPLLRLVFPHAALRREPSLEETIGGPPETPEPAS
jgi:hypothetical protein